MKHQKTIAEALKVEKTDEHSLNLFIAGNVTSVKQVESVMNLHLKHFIENLINEFHDCKHWEIVGFVKAEVQKCNEEGECAIEGKGTARERVYEAQDPETVNGIIEKLYVWQTDTAIEGESVGAALIPFTGGLFIKVGFSFSARTN